MLSVLPIPVPEENEQTKIASFLNNCDCLICSEKTHLKKLKEMKAGLMQYLLTGKVRVKVDISDETPA